jgi:hypothetical protein
MGLKREPLLFVGASQIFGLFTACSIGYVLIELPAGCAEIPNVTAGGDVIGRYHLRVDNFPSDPPPDQSFTLERMQEHVRACELRLVSYQKSNRARSIA